MTTASNDISNLDFAVLVDLSTITPTVKFTNLSTGPNLALVKWLFKVYTPNNTLVHTSTFASPDVTGNYTDFTIPENLPQIAGNIIWSGSAYRFSVEAEDAAGKKFLLEKTKEIKQPTGYKAGSNYGAGIIDIQARCQDALLYAEDQTNYAYMKLIQPSTIIQKKFTLLYPATDQGVFPAPYVINDFTNGLIPISYSGDGYTAVLESIVQYDLGDYVKVQIKYKFKECFPVLCNVDLCELTCEYNDMVAAAQKDGCDDELANKLTLINAKINMALIGKMQPLCKINVGKLIQEIKEIGGFTCNCDCGKGIVAMLPSAAAGVADCNAVIACVNGVFNQVDPKCLYPTGWALTSLITKLQFIMDQLSGGKCDCSAPADVTYDIQTKKLKWRTTNDAYQWKVEYMLNNNGTLRAITSPAPVFIGAGFWEINLATMSFTPGGSYVFYVAAKCARTNSTSAASMPYIPNGCTAVTFPTSSLANPVAGQPYITSRSLSGTGPFTITGAVVKPAWLTIAIVGNILQFSGTPLSGDTGINIPVSFTVSNGCGTQNLITQFSVTSNCVGVSFVKANFPTPQVGQPYIHNIALNGSAPFVLYTPVAPNWMNFNIVGTTLQITGTPPIDAIVGVGQDVQFAVGNPCGKDFQSTSVINTASECISVTIPNATFPNAAFGTNYTLNINLVGTPPFTLTGVTKPSWMNMLIVGSTLQITGVPFVPESDVQSGFTVNNACGTVSKTFMIDVTAPTCVPPSFAMPAGLPDATVGLPYEYLLPVTGTAPFTLIGGIKPAWMNVTLVNNPTLGWSILFAGTPPSNAIIETGKKLLWYLNNACGQKTGYDYINTLPGIVPIEFQETITQMPNATIGTPYNFSRTITGTEPYVLADIIFKPAWMTIALVGSQVQFTGTPTGAPEVDHLFGYTISGAEGPYEATESLTTLAAL